MHQRISIVSRCPILPTRSASLARALPVAVLLCLVVTTQASAQTVSTSAYVAATSDYVFRGISLTSEQPALQGGLDLGWRDLSFSVWASNVDFGGASTADAETDLGVVWSRAVTDRIGLSLQVFRFLYFGEGGLDYSEYSAIVDVANATIGFYFASDYGGTDGNGTYVDLGYAVALPQELSLGLHAGRNEFQEAVGIADYWDYRASLSRSFGRLDVDVSFITTDLPEADASDARIVGSVTAHF